MAAVGVAAVAAGVVIGVSASASNRSGARASGSWERLDL